MGTGTAWRLATAAAFSLGFADAALAQRVTDNAIATAEDAFGGGIANERIGLYSASEVRGFSPIVAGNIRLEGLYIDRPGQFTDRLVESHVVRVGLSAQNYLFPAPTGVVDYRIRPAGDKLIVSALAGYGTMGGGRGEIDAQIPIVPGKLSVAAGLAGFYDEYASGSDAYAFAYNISPRWRPAPGVEVIPFWSRVDVFDKEAIPLYVGGTGVLPGRVERRNYVGPRWADQRLAATNYGVIGKANTADGWSFAGGLFRSVNVLPTNYAAVLSDIRADHTGVRQISADPEQSQASTSGEARISRAFVEGERLHVFSATVRARDRLSLYSGGSTVNLGRADIERKIDIAEPAFSLGLRTREEVRQVTGGLAYEGRWRGRGSLSLGVQRTDYRKEVDRPGVPVAKTHDPAWLYNAALAVEATPKLAFYGSYTRGLEESGVAPDSAANRTQALPAILTRQWDAGLRYALPNNMRFVGGAFEVEKPYFAPDAANIFTELGMVRHRGLELSLSGSPRPGLTVVGGAVLMKPEVTGEPVERGLVGRKPVGQTGRLLTLNLNQDLPIKGLTAVANLNHHGDRVGDRANLVETPARTIVDLGLRYRFQAAGVPALLRLNVTNVTNAFDWRVVSASTYEVNAPRSFILFLTMDF